MNCTQTSAIAVGVIILLATALVTAHSQMTSTPLYTVRMEQASSKMHFLSTAMNEFTYTAEKGYEVPCGVSAYCAESLNATGNPCEVTDETCPQTEETCPRTCFTCNTCLPSCGYTCGSTCGLTCNSCKVTCENTCNPTCTDITCDSCSQTCNSCNSTCDLTCGTCFGC